MLFASLELVLRIERAEAHALRTILDACAGDTRAVSIGGGLALYRGPGSPLNKVLGVGFEQVDEHALAQVEKLYLERGSPVQVEVSTYARPELVSLLARRGYQLAGFENVLGRRLDDVGEAYFPELEVRRARALELDAWVEVVSAGFAQLAGNEQAAAHDNFDRAALEQVFRDMAQKPTLDRWLAFRNGEVAGGASVSMQDGIAQLFGAATHPAHRSHGIQAALLAARLRAGRDAQCELATLTTQPGSQSHHNALKAGFCLLYSRAIWLRAA